MSMQEELPAIQSLSLPTLIQFIDLWALISFDGPLPVDAKIPIEISVPVDIPLESTTLSGYFKKLANVEGNVLSIL